MRYLSVCAGIEAATMAWHPLGWEAAAFSEIEPFPRAVLAHRYPATPLHGDFTTIEAEQYGAIDLLVGGTPCQSFSVAGLRGGLDDDRGNLALEFLRLAQRTRPKWLVWENVPGVLSSNGGRDFGAILGGMVECGYGFAYRVLDAQHFGVPQRRRRVFVVGYLGDWRPAAAVLFERHSLSGHSAPRREKGQAVAGYTASSFGGYREGCGTLRADGGDYGGGTETLLTGTLTATYGEQSGQDMMAEGMLAIAFGWQNSASQGDGASEHITPTLDKSKTPAIALQDIRDVQKAQNGKGWNDDGSAYTVDTHATQGVATTSTVRRLTPVECERLQGFPDNFTAIPWRGKPAEECPDGPRYKALGNSMAVPCMAWLGQRIQAVEDVLASQRKAA